MGETAIKENTLCFWDYSAQNTTSIWEYLPVRVHGKFVCKTIEVMMETLTYLALAMDHALAKHFTNNS